jgi:DNA gyrase/topoisomerase IV subunit B
VPKFAKTVESEISTSVSFLTDKTKLIDNEITVKENILSELNKNNVSNERIEFLWKNNENLTKQMEEEKRKFRIWKIAKMTEEYLKTMNKDEKVVKKEDTIKMFIAGIGKWGKTMFLNENNT